MIPESKITRSLGLVAFTAALAACLAAPSRAGQPGGVGEEDPIGGRPFDWSETRDPMEFESGAAGTGKGSGGSIMDILGTPKNSTGTDDPNGDGTQGSGADQPGVSQKALRLKMRKMAEERIAEAEVNLAERNYSAVVERTVQALNAIEAAQLPAPVLAEKLKRAGETARRLKDRADIEGEFRNLQIVIQGIAWSSLNPVALINGEIKRPGELVHGARIEEIGQGEVVFSLKGVRVKRISNAVAGD